eukprot:m.155995 g.155995  ORF g.155995 m.155995 type:complete len:377 (+) comp30966_c0_seq1:203-1333(+)
MYEDSDRNANSSHPILVSDDDTSNRKNAVASNSRWPMVFQVLVVVLLLWNAIAQSCIAFEISSLQSPATMKALNSEISSAVSSGISDGLVVGVPRDLGKLLNNTINDFDLSAMTETVLAFDFAKVATNITTLLNGKQVTNGMDIYAHTSCLFDRDGFQTISECVQRRTSDLKEYTNVKAFIVSVVDQIARLKPPITPAAGSEPKGTVDPLGIVEAIVSKVTSEFDPKKWEKLAPSCNDLESRLKNIVDPKLQGVYNSFCELRYYSSTGSDQTGTDSNSTTQRQAIDKPIGDSSQPSSGDVLRERRSQAVYGCSCPVGQMQTSNCEDSILKASALGNHPPPPPQFNNNTCTCAWNDQGYLTDYVISSMDTICKAMSV